MKDTIKIVLIGELFSGKTTLIFRYVNNQYVNNNISNMSVDFKAFDFYFLGKNIKIELWDTSGRKNFRNITKQYIKGVDIIIMVYSVDDRESFEEIKTFWLPTVKEECEENDDGK